MTNGLVIQFRRSRRSYTPRHFLIEIEGIDSRDKAKQFVGKEVVWASPSKTEIKGKVSAAHGNKGVIRAIFEKGLPGQAIGTECKIADSTETKSTKVKK
ncbi:50S ribosomal protein L35Ae [uncultured archaeon]|nr:50S ribosomal protein L35Ae [uncultured archaeon]